MVLMNAMEAIKQSPRELSDSRKMAIMLASLLHDADDRKYF